MNRVFDRLVEFDEKSKEFPIMAALAPHQLQAPRSYTWGLSPRLDQGHEGACVGFGWTNDLAARPVVVPNLTNDVALAFYHEFQKNDEFPGEDYEGTSVLAGAKTLTSFGWYGEYRWAFGLDDLILAVGYKGPAVLGLNWHDSMYDPDGDGYLRPTGNVVGGHCIICNGVSIPKKRFLVTNSWGANWGRGGQAYVSFDDMAALLKDQGEACIPVSRKRNGRFSSIT